MFINKSTWQVKKLLEKYKALLPRIRSCKFSPVQPVNIVPWENKGLYDKKIKVYWDMCHFLKMKGQIRRISNSDFWNFLFIFWSYKWLFLNWLFYKNVKHKNLLNIRSTQILKRVFCVVFINATLCDYFTLNSRS